MKVVIIGFFPETAKDRIRGSFPCAWDVKIVLPDEAEQELTDADVLIPEHILIDDGILQKAPKLRLVQTGCRQVRDMTMLTYAHVQSMVSRYVMRRV